MKNINLKILVLVVFLFMNSCERENKCETKQNCFRDENGGQRCFDVPVNCIENDFGF